MFITVLFASLTAIGDDINFYADLEAARMAHITLPTRKYNYRAPHLGPCNGGFSQPPVSHG